MLVAHPSAKLLENTTAKAIENVRGNVEEQTFNEKSEVSSKLYGENRAIKTRRKTRDTEKTVMKTIF